MLTPEAKDEVKGGLFLDVIIAKGPPILELFAGENEPLLLRRNPLLILDLRLDILDCVIGVDVESNGFASERFHKDLHVGTSPQTKHQMEG